MRLQNEEGSNLQDIEIFKHYKEKHFQGGHKRCPSALAWNTQGNLLVTAETHIKVWTFSEEHGLDKTSELKHQSTVDWAEFANNHLLGTLSRDALKFWDVRENGKISAIKTEKKNKQDFIRFAWNTAPAQSQQLKLAVLHKDSSVAIYDYRNTGTPLTTIHPPKSNSSLQYFGLGWDRSNSVLFLVGGQNNNGSISLFGGQTFQALTQPMVTHCARITDIVFSNNNEHFLTASQDSTLEVHSIPDIICERVFSNKSDSAYKRVSLSHDGQFAAASSQSSIIQIWNTNKGGLSWKLKCSPAQQVLAWHPKKMVLAYVDEEDKRKSMDRGDQNYVHLFYH